MLVAPTVVVGAYRADYFAIHFRPYLPRPPYPAICVTRQKRWEHRVVCLLYLHRDYQHLYLDAKQISLP